MEECELCGRKIEHAYVIDVEGVELRVCADCAAGKHVIEEPKPQGKKVYRKVGTSSEEQKSVVEGYGSIIRNARERMKIPLKVLAEMINEKETLLLRVEEEHTLPSIELTKKLEKALNIKLAVESSDDESKQSGRVSSTEASLGEFIKK
ncbi:MAG: helix-turn-helix domain-containing protein [Candidatus Micrarchaeia archaeon]